MDFYLVGFAEKLYFGPASAFLILIMGVLSLQIMVAVITIVFLQLVGYEETMDFENIHIGVSTVLTQVLVVYFYDELIGNINPGFLPLIILAVIAVYGALFLLSKQLFEAL